MRQNFLEKSFQIDVLNEKIYNYDNPEYFSTFFESSQSMLINETKKLIEKSPAFINFLKSLEKTEYFKANMSKKAEELYKSGELFLKYSKDKDGLLPTLYDKSGKFKEQVVLNPKQVSPDLLDSMTSLSMQIQLAQLMEQIQSMNNSIDRIERGQRDDRIGLYYSARQQYIESISMKNDQLRTQGLLNSAKTANNARFQLMQTMKNDINEIIYRKKLSKKDRDKLSRNVRDEIRFINESTGICIMCFSAIGEIKPMLSALKSYQCYIQQVLISKTESGLTVAEELHRNWNGNDNEWLKMPGDIAIKLEEIIEGFSKQLMINEGCR